MMKRILETFRRFRRGFREGPSWFPVPGSRKNRRTPFPILLLLWGYALLDRVLTPQGRMFLAIYLAIAC